MNFRYLLWTSLLLVAMSCKKKQSSFSKKEVSFDIKKHQEKIDSLIQLNFIDRSYEFLDDDFNIHIDSITFSLINHKDIQPKSYKDSLMVLLINEFNDDDAVRISFHRIVFSWKFLGYYLWENVEKTKEIAHSFGFNHPYRFFKFLKSEAEQTEQKKIFLESLRSKIENNLKEEVVISNFKEFLKFSFRNNPQRMDHHKSFMEKNKHPH